MRWREIMEAKAGSEAIRALMAAAMRFARAQQVSMRLRYHTGRHMVEITDLNAKFPGNGAGSKVMDHLCKLADSDSINLLVLPSNEQNRSFYQRFGFERSTNLRGGLLIRYAQGDDDMLDESAPATWWHGSASGDLRGGASGLHLGTYAAAKEALEARIGAPAEGEWDGTREYGKTKLAGRNNLKARGVYATGHNADAPEEDYFPHQHPHHPVHTYPNGEQMPNTVRPSIRPFHITGPMTNTIGTPHEDFKANGYMKAALKKGAAKRGYYYHNVAEDPGSISAVVPNGNHLTPATSQRS